MFCRPCISRAIETLDFIGFRVWVEGLEFRVWVECASALGSACSAAFSQNPRNQDFAMVTGAID